MNDTLIQKSGQATSEFLNEKCATLHENEDQKLN